MSIPPHNPELDPPDQFMYARQGPWPQPSPSHPLQCANEVLHIPPMEQTLFNATIGKRYVESRIGYPPTAAALAIEDMAWPGPSDADFRRLMFETLYTRFNKVLDPADIERCKSNGVAIADGTRKYDFSAMRLLRPIPGTYCAGTVLILNRDSAGQREATCIFVNGVCIRPGDAAWPLAMCYVLQGAAYHVLFVVHPALHFPMDSVNAITKTSVPITHPLLQLLLPHCNYQLALDHAVLESAESVVNNNAQGTRFDPLTADAYNLKLLFGAGYAGLPETLFGNAYPAYAYMEPQKGFDSAYGAFLQAYYEPFEAFCRIVTKRIIPNPELHEYVRRWARYNHAHVLGFPDEKAIFDPQTLATAMAIFMWDCSVSHGADHANFSWRIRAVEKCLRIRIPPPEHPDAGVELKGRIATADDLARAEICQYTFFKPWAIAPNLYETGYAFTDPALAKAAARFKSDLIAVSERDDIQQFMPLRAGGPGDAPGEPGSATYADTIPQSVQY